MPTSYHQLRVLLLLLLLLLLYACKAFLLEVYHCCQLPAYRNFLSPGTRGWPISPPRNGWALPKPRIGIIKNLNRKQKTLSTLAANQSTVHTRSALNLRYLIPPPPLMEGAITLSPQGGCQKKKRFQAPGKSISVPGASILIDLK